MLALFTLAGCASDQPEADAPVDPDQLRELLESELFLQTLGTDEFVILRQYPYRVVIETRGGRPRIWEMVYTIADGWRLKGEDERLILVPGQGYEAAQ